eukprot:jgi/Bigna1/144398/aug1.87_g19106
MSFSKKGLATMGHEALKIGDRTPLINAARKGQLDVVKYLVGMKANIESKDKNGWTSLIFAASEGRLDVVAYLVGMKANIEIKDEGGWTPLIHAASEGKLDVVKYLVGMKANVEVKNRNGDTPYDLAISHELKIFIKQSCIDRRVQVFNSDFRDLYFLSMELKRGLGAEVVATNSKK